MDKNLALETLKTFIEHSTNIIMKDAILVLHPELKESEDERIRKEAISIVQSYMNICDEEGDPCLSGYKVLAYLERQKDSKVVKFDHDREQKPVEMQGYSGLDDLERAIHRGFLSAGVENVPVTIIKETAQECLTQMNFTEWSEEDEERLMELISLLKDAEDYLKEHGNMFSYNPMLLIKWLKSLRPQPKQGWSDEDKAMLKVAIAVLRRYSHDDVADWLKSLKPQSHWKPSEEQMEALERTTHLSNFGVEEDRRNALLSLLDQLKKLM